MLIDSVAYISCQTRKAKRIFTYAKTKTQTSGADTAQLISTFVSVTGIIQSLFFLNPKFQDFSHLLWLHRWVRVRHGWKPCVGTHILTHISLASCLWDIGKQYSPRCDAPEYGVPSGAILFAYRNFIKK